VPEGTTAGPARGPHGDAASFGSFQLFPSARAIEKAGVPLALGNRALDILMVLVEHAGEVVSHKELISRAWRGLVVDPSNLRVHVSSLRKALGDVEDPPRYIANVAGQGYCFVAPVTRGAAASAHAHARARARAPDHASGAARQRLVLPPKLARMVGRDDAIRTIATDLSAERFVSVIGPGGMGKTTVALAVADALREEFGDAAFFIDLGTVTDPKLVPATIASTLGLTIHADDVLPALLDCLRALRVLLVLDNCEHVIDAAATLAELIFKEAPGAHILATSREALRVEGEHVYWLPPLESPGPDSSMKAADVREFPAVKLFMERAAASGSRLDPSDADAAIIAGICGRLDGIALAIELAAGRVASHGILGTADLLEKGLGLHWQGRRTAHPRHQTLQALLDWSYGYLSGSEQVVLRRLSLLVGAFTIDVAQALACDGTLAAEQVVDALDLLVAKSLVSAVAGDGAATRYRLLETTRVYAQKKLEENGERHATARRHALYFARVPDFGRDADSDSPVALPPADHLGNVRAALAWCFAGSEPASASPAQADRAHLAVDLAAASVPLLLELALLNECHQWSQKALALLDDTTRGSRQEMVLQEARAISAIWARGIGDDVRAAITRGLEIARRRGDAGDISRLLVATHLCLIRIGDFRGSSAVVDELAAVAPSHADESYMIIVDWTRGSSEHFNGNQAAARRHYEAGFVRAGARKMELFGLDYRVRALVTFARVLWLTGSPDRAMETARQAIGEAARSSKSVNVCFSLLFAAPVFLWCGDHDAAGDVLEQVTAHPNWQGLPSFHATALALKGELLVRRGELEPSIALLTAALATMRADGQNLLRARGSAACALAEALTGAERLDEARAVVDEALGESPAGEEPLELSELLRIKASILLAGRKPDEAEVESCLMRSLECARRQSATSWELRTAMALARFRAQRGASDHARQTLAAVYGRFTEGYETADLKAAKQLLVSVSSK
jgi:predicted ATPase/DNA-binding winged helix-turn-helix (wHTH) protein